MAPDQKARILGYMDLYPLAEDKKVAAERFVLPAAMFLRTYLHRMDLPQALEPVCAQLAVAQAAAAGIVVSMDTSQSQSGADVSQEAGIKSITQGDTTISFATKSDEHREAASSASNMRIAVSPAQVIEENRPLLNQYKKGLTV